MAVPWCEAGPGGAMALIIGPDAQWFAILYTARRRQCGRKRVFMLSGRRPFLGIVVLIVALALIEPVVHVWIVRRPPAGRVPSGLHTLDTYAYVSAMKYYGDDFYSPYAACHSGYGDRDRSLYALPHHHLYGLAGMLSRVLHVPPFFFLGVINGLGLAFCLAGAYVLLRSTVPQLAEHALVLFTLQGGLGGVLYVVCGLLGLHEDPEFPRYFMRFFVYELNEGARFQPYLLAARLYYTLPLGFGFLALAALATSLRRASALWMVAAALLQATAAFLNFRLGPMYWTGALLYLLCVAGIATPRGVWAAVAVTVGTLGGTAAAVAMLSQNPELAESVLRIFHGGMWLLPFLSATLFHWLVLPGTLGRSTGRLPVVLRMAGYGALGYLYAYTALYLGHQAYYGNWGHGGETSAAVKVSDAAFVGALLGLVYGYARRPKRDADSDASLGWWGLWFLVFLCAALTAMGHGWFLRFTPRRFMVILGLPLAVLTAAGLHRLRAKHPRLSAGLNGTILFCGTVSIVVTWTTVYGPLGASGVQQQFPWTHCAYISEADDRAIASLGEGVVLTPSLGSPLLGDVIACRTGNTVVYGNGTLDFSHQRMWEVRGLVADFYKPGASEAARRDLLEAWCVDYVYCPDIVPVDAAAVEELLQLPWLKEVFHEGQAVLFEVQW